MSESVEVAVLARSTPQVLRAVHDPRCGAIPTPRVSSMAYYRPVSGEPQVPNQAREGSPDADPAGLLERIQDGTES